jgi:flagellar assembly factor FliW
MENNVLASPSKRAAGTAHAPARASEERPLPCEIQFPQGLIGCPDWQRFQLTPEPFATCGELISLDHPGVGLIVADPAWLRINYHFELDEDDVEALRLTRAEDARVLCILTLHRDPAAIMANLAGPLIINWPERLGRQVILDHQGYPLRAPVVTGEAAGALIAALAGADRETSESAAPPSPPTASQPGKGA